MERQGSQLRGDPRSVSCLSTQLSLSLYAIELQTAREKTIFKLDLNQSQVFFIGGGYRLMEKRPTLQIKLLDFIRTNDLLKSRQKVVLAVSGGIDSMVLLDLCLHLKSSEDINLFVAHVNHQLRGEESMLDENFVQQVCEESGIPFFCQRVDTLELAHRTHVSKQEAARNARYRFFEEVRVEMDADCIATAHQANDNVETLLLNVGRGTGIRGLSGIPLQRQHGLIIRPLLFAKRREIVEYAQARNVRYRDDSSNSSSAYARNVLRHQIIPLLEEEFGPSLTDSVSHFTACMRRFSHLVDQYVSRQIEGKLDLQPGRCELQVSAIKALPRFAQQETILKVFRHLGIEPHAGRVEDILAFLGSQSGRELQLSKNLVVLKDRDRLEFLRKTEAADIDRSVTPGNEYIFGHGLVAIGRPEPVPTTLPKDRVQEYVDADRLAGSLHLRTWRHGDWFIPLGMNGKKKLSDFFNDERIPRIEKGAIPILESEGNIVWVCGKRLDDRYKVTQDTRSVVRLSFTPLT
jgi:tRNA(Ile)-lysidine synthase